MPKRIYSFGGGSTEGDQNLNALLGNKGANLAEMSRIGVPIPPGFTITTDVCREYYARGLHLPDGIDAEIETAMGRLESAAGRMFGDSADPLLVSVRSGAPVSMPGMMDTVLNIGLTRKGVDGLAVVSGDEPFAQDTYRRLIQMFGNVVMNTLPEDPRAQLRMAVEAVFRSWNTPRAVAYRKINRIPDDLGTAVTVQVMVFGNRGSTSASGVLFTRDPSTGENRLTGEYLVNSQGEDVVAGTHTPAPIHRLREEMPGVYAEIEKVSRMLERHFKEMQDIEFTVEQEKLWILQTRNAKQTARAAVRSAVEMAEEGMLARRNAVERIQPAQLDQFLHPVFDPEKKKELLAAGLPASPGAVSGKIVFTTDAAERRSLNGEKVILVRRETSPEDIQGMHAAEGILTSRGGMTSHAAVVARGMGKCCIVGCGEIDVREEEGWLLTPQGEKIEEGTLVSLNGGTGEIFRGEIPTVSAETGKHFGILMGWADASRKIKVRANADTPDDCTAARKFGAEGIGLCRTEHMFFDKSRIDVVRQMILARTPEERSKHLEEILPMQLADFRGIFEAMRGFPVTVRLLDPPLHEFLPSGPEEIEQLACRIGSDIGTVKRRLDELKESNPMLGHRGSRLAITFPEIYDVQVRAVITAACEAEAAGGGVFPEIMLPLIIDPREFSILKKRTVETAERVKAELRSKLKYLVGTMIEVPRAALLAGEIAKEADFFSFGTNDLTQTAMGLSRDDSSRFLPAYIEQGILPRDPFSTLDESGVLELIRIAAERGRKTNPNLKIGICGEHGGDPDSIALLRPLHLDYVSCSPFRVPAARLKAAQLEPDTLE